MFCPVCNGLQQLAVSCTQCSGSTEDLGRVLDWSGPYSPYEPIVTQELYISNGINAVGCNHTMYCETCQVTFEVAVAEWGTIVGSNR